MRTSPIIEEKVQKHLAEAARLLRGPMLDAPDWAEDIEATAHAIQNEFNEKRKWNADNRDMINLINDKIKTLSSDYNIELEGNEIDDVIESIIIDGYTESSSHLDKMILTNMIQELQNRNVSQS